MGRRFEEFYQYRFQRRRRRCRSDIQLPGGRWPRTTHFAIIKRQCSC